MADLTDGFTMVLGPDEGEGFWQPQPSRGYAINKITPYNSPHNNFSLGIQILEPGAHIRRHAHERQDEVLFCYDGKGRADVGGKMYDVVPETTLLLGRNVFHKIENTGDKPMRLLWVILPAGLEDWFADIGKPRQPSETVAPTFERPHNVDQIEAMVRLVQLQVSDKDA
jgi:mannose-6-phosphate isomerase-like protein (cupin superfamily)